MVICFIFVCIYIISQEVPTDFELFTLKYRTIDYIYYR